MTDEEIKQIRQIVWDVIRENEAMNKLQESEDDDYDDGPFDDDDFDEYDTRYGCKCGAWVVSETSGKLCHVADCICGAE